MITLEAKEQVERSNAGFTLAEVTLAMGIAAIALSIVFAMMPASMEQLQKATDISAEHRIFNRIAGEVRAHPWAEVEKLNGTFRFYTSQGMSLPQAEKDSLSRVYTARIEVMNDTTGVHASDESRRIVIKISHLPDYAKAFSNDGNAASFRTYSTIVSSMEK